MSWLEELRVQNADAFSKMGGWPTQKQEAWHFTNLSRHWLQEEESQMESSGHIAMPEALQGAQTLAFIDGSACPGFAPATHPLPSTTHFKRLGELLQEEDKTLQNYLKTEETPIAAYNTARMVDGTLITVDQNGKDTTPLHLFYMQTGGRSVVRNIVHVKQGASLTLVEHYCGHAGYTQPLTHIILEEGATLHHTRVQESSGSHLGHSVFHLSQAATLHHTSLNINAPFNRHQMVVNLNGPQCNLNLNVVQLVQNSQFTDTTLTVHHNAPNCTATINNRNVASGAAHAVFQGKLHVQSQAQKTAANMQCKNLLGSAFARASTKPELEIYADDVACAHGNATGALNPEALFYLQSRGFSGPQAHALLVQSFIEEFLTAANPACTKLLQQLAQKWV